MPKAVDASRKIELGITRLEYGEADRPQRAVLELSTHKHYNGGLISTATVFWHGEHSKSNLISLGGGSGDFTRRLRVSERTVRATQKNIDTQHAAAFPPDVIASQTQAAKDHYARFVAEGVDGMKNTYFPAIQTLDKAQEASHA